MPLSTFGKVTLAWGDFRQMKSLIGEKRLLYQINRETLPPETECRRVKKNVRDDVGRQIGMDMTAQRWRR
jgi:hypothetical protein